MMYTKYFDDDDSYMDWVRKKTLGNSAKTSSFYFILFIDHELMRDNG
jgi:hypothetical protein